MPYRACLTTIYACGLRLMEGIGLQVPDIDSARGVLHIHGKGGRDRYVPLPEATLALLRAHWLTHRNPVWLFPAPLSGLAVHTPAVPTRKAINSSALQSAFVGAAKQCGIQKRAQLCTRFATHGRPPTSWKPVSVSA